MGSRVLATWEAADAAAALRARLVAVAATARDVIAIGDRLSDPVLWDGPAAVQFREAQWPQARRSMRAGVQQLEELESRAGSVIRDILTAGRAGLGPERTFLAEAFRQGGAAAVAQAGHSGPAVPDSAERPDGLGMGAGFDVRAEAGSGSGFSGWFQDIGAGLLTHDSPGSEVGTQGVLYESHNLDGTDNQSGDGGTGAYVGAAPFLWLTNASRGDQLRGTVETWNFNVALGVALGGSFSRDDHGVWFLQGGIKLGVGVGASGSHYPSHTDVSSTNG